MNSPRPRVVYRFENFVLDADAYELKCQGRRVHLARQPMDFLLLLAGKAGRLVTREEIANHLWGEDVFGDLDASTHTAVMKIRKALGESGKSERFIETVSGRGYRFVARVEILQEPLLEPTGAPFPQDSSLGARRHNLPADLTSFLGRERELDGLGQLLASSRLLTLTGSGGVGKTRLARRLAATVVGEFVDGIWMVDLGSLFDPNLLPETIATTLGLRESPHRPARRALIEYLADKTMLLLLDTCEHLVAACAELVELMLCDAPRLRIMATSREPLRVPGEVIYRVPSLSLPGSSAARADVDSEGVRLFIERAHATDPAFEPSASDVATIARICCRLDGIPLAIELAAARVAMLSPKQIESRLQNRFHLLTGAARNAVARQRTLESTIEWSYNLLSHHERLLLDRVSVFPASWALDSAEAVCAGEPIRAEEVMNLLSRLVDKSLVVLDGPAGTEQRRYRLLDTVHDYSTAQLARNDRQYALHAKHFDWLLARFRDSQRILRGFDQLARLEELRTENASLRAALEWALSTPTRGSDAVEFASALFWYWTKSGSFEEGKRWLQRARLLDVPPSTRARVLYGLANMHYFQGDLQSVGTCAVEVEALGVETGDAWAISVGRFFQALAAFELGDFDGARALAIAARQSADVCGEMIEHGGPLMILANVALVREQQEEALRLYDESIQVHRRAGDIWGLSILLSIAGGLRVVRGDLEGGQVCGAEALSLSQALRDPRGIAWSLEVFAGVLAATGRPGGATRLWGLSDALLEKSGGALTATIGWIRNNYTDPVRTQMGEVAFAAARAEGKQLSPDDAVTLVRDGTQTSANEM
jgi:predicted ATPase/DNA-binding winged helix-turn-helix (wHTH) protein